MQKNSSEIEANSEEFREIQVYSENVYRISVALKYSGEIDLLIKYFLSRGK